MESAKRYGIDRRFENDKRQVYNLNYFLDGGEERRCGTERRGIDERRIGWVKTDDWQSVYLGNLICADDFSNREDYELPFKSTMVQTLKNVEDKRTFDRFLVREYAYAVLRPSSRKVGQIVDISRGGLSFRYPDTGSSNEDVPSLHLDIFLVGVDFHLAKVPFKTVSERTLDIDLPDHSMTMVQCGVEFDTLTDDQLNRLDILIEEYTRGRP